MCPRYREYDPLLVAAAAGYSRLHVANGTHLLLEYVDNKAGAVLDSVWIVKDAARHDAH
jgi:hypothetical protein